MQTNILIFFQKKLLDLKKLFWLVEKTNQTYTKSLKSRFS